MNSEFIDSEAMKKNYIQSQHCGPVAILPESHTVRVSKKKVKTSTPKTQISNPWLCSRETHSARVKKGIIKNKNTYI